MAVAQDVNMKDVLSLPRLEDFVRHMVVAKDVNMKEEPNLLKVEDFALSTAV